MIYVVIATTKDRRPRLQEAVEAIKASICTEPITICTYENSDGGWVKAYHKLLEGFKDDAIIFNIGDDVIVSPNCIQTLWEKFTEQESIRTSYKPLLLQPYEQIQEGRICTSGFSRVWVVKEYLYKGYIHNFADNEMTIALGEIGAYLYVPEAITDHRHFVRDRKLYDETYDINQRHYSEDHQLFIKRQQNNFEPKNEYDHE